MDEELTLEDKIRINSELVMTHLSKSAGFDLGLNAASVEWVDGFIERQRSREDFDLETNAGLSNKLGCFLGEALCNELGGNWQQTEYGPGVVFPDGKSAFPLNKVAKQFANGQDDSILSFYETALVMFGEKAG